MTDGKWIYVSGEEQVRLTREEVVTIVMAIEEFRGEYAGPHLAENRALAGRVNDILKALGDEFILVPWAEEDASSGG